MSRGERRRPSARVALPSACEIVITREFTAPRTEVFAAWTTAARVADWWDPRGLPLARCDIDLRPGGTFRFEPQGGGARVFTGRYQEIAPPDRLVFTTPGPTPGQATVGTLVFTEQGRVTTLTITMTAASAADRDVLLTHRVDAGTAQTLDHLAAHLERAASH